MSAPIALLLLASGLVCSAVLAAPSPAADLQNLASSKAVADLARDANGIFHIRATSEDDLFYTQGWAHAQDRLFQMDQSRRAASGTLAELFGQGALASDVQLRTIGLRRAAQRSLLALLPETRAALDAYARGVNDWAAANALPPEYAALELSRFEPWTPVDSVVIGKLIAFGLSFNLDIDSTIALSSYQQAGLALGFNGAKLFSEDLDRSAPFDPAATIPDSSFVRRASHDAASLLVPDNDAALDPVVIDLARRYRDQLSKIPAFAGVLDSNRRAASNLWAVSGRLSTTGHPLIANDPHLDLYVPFIFYPNGLEIPDRLDVFGTSFPGVPGVVLGYNRHIAWGSTNNGVDVTDTYQEQLVPDPSSPSGLSSLYRGQLEPVIPIPEVFRANVPGDRVLDNVVVVPPGGPIPAATLIVPRRNNGPIVQLDTQTGRALSVQYTGFSATREIDTFIKLDYAANLEQFVAALQYFDFGSQNFVYGDDQGNIAYFTSGEIPVREDLQAMTVNGLPPWFIRNGQGGNEWLAVQHPQPNQAVGYEVLPFAEMPQVVNPAAGWFVNGNNDPLGLTLDNNALNSLRPGGGLYYMAYQWNRGYRAGRITQRIVEYLSSGSGKISLADMQSIQADVVLRDAEYFTPWIVAALDRAAQAGATPALAAFAANAGVKEAVTRLRRWNRSTPTGLTEGWDAGKRAGVAPTQASVNSSVAATLYDVWRSRFIANTVDRALVPLGLPTPDGDNALVALRNLLENFSTRQGKGASGLDFFAMPGVAAADDRRDIVILRSMAEGLSLLASDTFKPAFANSTRQGDYQWGKLHRIVFEHPLGGPFSIPPAGGAFPAPLPGLAGIPTDGGFQTVDASSHDLRAAGVDGFMFNHGPVRRFVADMAPGAIHAESIWPGGTSGVLGSPYYAQFLSKWLANETMVLHLGSDAVRSTTQVEALMPAAVPSR